MKKIISSILAASFIFATCAINVMAATTARTMTVSATPSTDLKAGDTVVVEVKLSNNANVNSCGYKLNFDSNIFEFDTNVTSDEIPAGVDADWYFDEILYSRGAWFKAVGAPQEKYTDSSIALGWAGSAGVDSAKAEDDFVIGKFTFTVKSGVTASSAKIEIDSDTNTTYVSTIGENSVDPLTTVPATVTFKSSEPTATPWEVTITEEPAQAHGYIWKVDTTKGDGDLTKFDVTFTDDTPETFERSILSATKDAYNWNAPTSFYVGLYTTRTGVTADWKAASTKDGKVIEATIK